MNEVQLVIADDDASLVALLEKQLTDAGYTVSSCGNGNDALELVAHSEPVILLADWEMPGLTGVELCEKLQVSKAHGGVYIILLTGNGEPDQVVAGFEPGADDYLVKPAHPAELLARVQAGERVLRLRVQQQRAYAQTLECEIADRKQAEEALHNAHRDAKQLLDAIMSVLIGVDANDRVTTWNTATERIFGIEAEDAVGQSFDDLRVAWDRAAVTKAISQCRACNPDLRIERPAPEDG